MFSGGRPVFHDGQSIEREHARGRQRGRDLQSSRDEHKYPKQGRHRLGEEVRPGGGGDRKEHCHTRLL